MSYNFTYDSGHPFVGEEVDVEVGGHMKSTPHVGAVRCPGHHLGFVPVNIVPVALEGWKGGYHIISHHPLKTKSTKGKRKCRLPWLI